MRSKLQIFLVYGFSVAAMIYAMWQLNFSLIPQASADWGGGCCRSSAECSHGLLCYSRHDMEFPCDIVPLICGYNDDGTARYCMVSRYGWCNDKPFPRTE
jgi:hypothetical protein